MRRAMSYVAPWAMVTALAVALSWLGVRDVVRGAISDRSSPPPVSGPVIHASPTPPASVGTAAARPSPREQETASGTAAPSPRPSKRPERDGDRGADRERPGNVRSYSTRGGRAALAISDRRVQLVSATPNAGYETRVTKAEGWLRVDFIDDHRTSSVIASFYQHAPTVEIYEYGNRS
ncbi:hypothetical protein [Actinomadura sp. 9N407]|uniref:hypothetical protein n=1 Tax=Actinomadura sp. 9N407 TaxID=3375154 RepID=UPI00379CB990